MQNKISYTDCYICLIESLGDIVACEPIVRYVKNLYQTIKVHWIIKEQYKSLIEYNPNIESIITVDSLYTASNIIKEKSKDENVLIIDCHYSGRVCNKTGYVHKNMHVSGITICNIFEKYNILNAFSNIAGLPEINETPIFFLKKNLNLSIELPENYIVFHCKTADSSKDWTDENWNILANKILSLGYNIVEIGLEPIIKSKNPNYFDLTNRFSFQELALLIKNSSMFIGLDSGFTHIANCFNKYSIILGGKYLNFSERKIWGGNMKNLKILL